MGKGMGDIRGQQKGLGMTVRDLLADESFTEAGLFPFISGVHCQFFCCGRLRYSSRW